MVKAESYTDVTVHIAYEMITNHTQYPNLLILDVRTQSEYDESHLYNATLIPHDEIDARISELEPYNNSEIIVYCRSGSRSAIASQNLAGNYNFTKIYNMLGGITEWIIEGYPVWRNSNGLEQPEIGFSLSFFIMILFGTITILLIYYKKHDLKQKN
ncbi:MAG: rhodanese-like domain-containing protein [Promethearchaeota archaeon]